MALTGDYQVAKVHHINPNSYTKYGGIYIFALYPNKDGYYDCVIGDYVLTDTSQGFSVAIIDEITSQEMSGTLPTREIICKLNMKDFEQRRENKKLKESLKKKMDKIVKSEQELMVYQMIAEKNPEMKELFEKYSSL